MIAAGRRSNDLLRLCHITPLTAGAVVTRWKRLGNADGIRLVESQSVFTDSLRNEFFATQRVACIYAPGK